MSTAFFAKKEIEIADGVAWKALKEMPNWLHQLDSITSIDYDKKQSFFVEGRKYSVLTPEKITMSSKILEIDKEKMSVTIQARFLLLHSKLVCQVIPISAEKCLITRKQEYIGLVGKLFATLFKKREDTETNDYLIEWENYAINLLQNYY